MIYLALYFYKQGYTIGTFSNNYVIFEDTYRDLVQGDKPPETPQLPRIQLR